MSQSPSYQRDSASASPESPKEGDFSPRQLYDNLKSLEEHETCDDQKDPVVNIIPDNYSSSLLNAQICAPLAANDLGKLCAGMLPQEQPIKKSHRRAPRCLSTSSPIKKEPLVSPEFMEVLTLDGRFITLASAQTQTDWEWVEQSLSFSCQVQKEIEDPQLLQTEVVSMDTVADYSESRMERLLTPVKEPEDVKMPETEHKIPCVGPPRLIAYKPEPKQTPHVEKVPEVESKQDVLLAQCDYCQQLCQPFVHSELLENETDFERPLCCEQAKQMRELIMGEKEKLAQKESDRKIDVNLHGPAMSEEKGETAEERAKEKLRLLQLKRKPKKDNLNMKLGCIEIKRKTTYRLSEEIPCINDEPPIPQIDIKNTTDLFILQEETDGEPKLKKVVKKFYKSGKSFLTLCPDETGNVFYPSGKAAIIISSSEAADFTYIILEDKDVAPSIKGFFTNKGHATCYHPNGMMWLNLTPVGGLLFSETGALRRRWNWLYRDPHVRNLPFKPLTFALGPHISVRIHSQERMYITFAHQQNNVHFNVGSKLKLIYPESRDKPGQDVLERYIQTKSSEIYSLLGRMQTCMSHRSASLSNIKPHYRFIAQTQRLSRQMEKKKSPEKIKADRVKDIKETKIQTVDSPGKSTEMDSATHPGLVNKQSVSSPEYLTIHAFDGRVVTRISLGSQTDWRHEEERSQDYKYPNQEISKDPYENVGLTSERMSVLRWGKYPEDGRQTGNKSVPKNMKSELEISPDNEVLDSLSEETPQTPAACQGETEESLTNLDKISSSSGSDSSEELLQTVLNICCEHCQQLKKPPVTDDQIANSVDRKKFFCCKKAWKSSEMLLKGAAVITKETVTDRDPAMRKDQRLKGLEFESSDRQTPKAGHRQVSNTPYNRLPDDAWTSCPNIEVTDFENTFSFNGANAAQKRTTPLVKHYNNGKTFIVIFPDGTGQVCYPSGRLAVLVCAAQSADWCCVMVLEDKHLQPQIQAVFTSRGQGTCYHNNGCIWVNLTPCGGTYCNDTGELKKHWSWQENKNHTHAPPHQPLNLTLSPNLNIRIQSQEHICLTFTSGERCARLNVGAKLKPNQGKSLTLPGPDMLQSNLQQKSAEINVLLQNIQSLITYQKTVSPRKVKPQQRLITQMERRRLPMKQQQSAKKTP